jgi:hypothetical protein
LKVRNPDVDIDDFIHGERDVVVMDDFIYGEPQALP